MNASTFLPVVCEATLRILSRYVLELSVNATILVGSFSRMMTRESAKICSEAELARQHLTSPHLTSPHTTIRSATRRSHSQRIFKRGVVARAEGPQTRECLEYG
jgi:hypothetical protein